MSGAKAIRILGINGVLLFVATSLQAQDLTAGDGIVERIQGVVSQMGDRLSGIVIGLLFTLLAADIVLTFGRAVISGAELKDVVSRFVFRLLFVMGAMFFAQNVTAFVDAFINAALSLGATAVGREAPLDPSVSGILGDGVDYALKMVGETSIYQPASWLFVLVALIVLVSAALVAGILLLVYVEFYLIAFSGMVVLSLAGLSSTKEAAVVYVRTVIGQALKLLGFLITFAFMNELTLGVLSEGAGYAVSLGQAITAAMLQVLMLVLLSSIPSAMQALAGGISSGGASDMVAKMGASATIAAVSAGAGAAAGATAGAALGGAGGLAGGGGTLGGTIASTAKGIGSGMKGGASAGLGKGARLAQSTSGTGVGRSTAALLHKLSGEINKNGS